MTDKTHRDATIERPSWLTPDAWPFEIRSTTVDSKTVAYTDEGSGPVLLLVHDGMWSFVWGQLIKRLRPDFRVVTLDFPGSGLSPATSERSSLESDSRLLETLLDHLGIDTATLVVHDLGGSVGLGLAARRPDLANGLILINTFAWPPHVGSLRAMFSIMTSGPMRALNTSTNLIPRMTSSRFGIGQHLDQASRQAFLGGFESREARIRFHDMMQAARDETQYLESVEAALGSVLSGVPALTVFGEKNDPFGFQAKFHEYLRDVEDMVVPGGNHFPMGDDPDSVADRIIEWHQRKVVRMSARLEADSE
jgi:pimeloyl-ACP methyl ester carboxylesterase